MATRERLALTGGSVVTSLDPPTVRVADVAVEGERIAGFEVPADAATIDCSGCVVIPGNVCAHHHLYSSLARGMPYALDPPENFLQILQRVWWRLDRALDPGTIWASALVGGAEALLAGTTTIVDHHASPNAAEDSLEQVASRLEELGARSILCYEVSDRDGPAPAEAGLEATRRFLKDWPDVLTRGMVGAHASFTLSDETLVACVELAREFDAGLHVHVAEDAVDQRHAEAAFGTRVVHRLAEAGALGEGALLAHCIHVSPDEAMAIRETGATPVHNPRSNMNNRVGHAPVALLGDRLALGTDGIGGDMFAEGRAAYWRAREVGVVAEPGWILGRLAQSARFAGAIWGEPLLGRIEPGAPADLVVLDYDPPTPLTEDTLGWHWAFGISARHVRDVLVAGEEVVRDRRLARVDQDEVMPRAREEAERLWRRMEDVPAHPFVPAGTGG